MAHQKKNFLKKSAEEVGKKPSSAGPQTQKTQVSPEKDLKEVKTPLSSGEGQSVESVFSNTSESIDKQRSGDILPSPVEEEENLPSEDGGLDKESFDDFEAEDDETSEDDFESFEEDSYSEDDEEDEEGGGMNFEDPFDSFEDLDEDEDEDEDMF